MRITDELLKKYARMIVRIGANVQPGQVVSLSIAVEQHDFAALVAEECYLAGAKLVNIEWYSDKTARVAYTYAEEDSLAEVYSWQEEKAKQMVSDLPCRIFIDSDDPDALAGLNADKITNVMRRRAAVLKKYRDAIDGKHQWAIAAVPSPAWAKKCFPHLEEDDAIQALWDAVLLTSRVDDTNDPVTVWNEHTGFISGKAQWMNEQGFSALRYRSNNGTDFYVELIPGALWEGAGTTNALNGAYYVPNMPTEEVFTSPAAGKCEGTLVATKPLSWNSQLIENFSITFENGRATSCCAEKGQELLEKMIHMDENAALLGEVALVPKESPVNQSGLLFYNTLFDENACCHVALGCGFKECLPNGDELTVEEAQKYGINDSVIHVDFMVGADDLSITGICPDGSEIPVFINGTWA